MSFDAVILDIDGTLWDSRALVAEGYNIQLKSEGLERLCVDAARLKTLFGKVMSDIADELFYEFPPEVRYPLMERCMETENRHLQECECDIGYPEVKETLQALAKKYRLFIVSNSQCGYPELVMEKLGLTELIEGHLCFGDTGTSKGQTILTLMRKFNIQNPVYIGDTQGDLDATEEAGIPFIFAAYGFGTVSHCLAQVTCPRELLNIL